MHRTAAILFALAWAISGCGPEPEPEYPVHCELSLDALTAEYLLALRQACPHTRLDDCPEAVLVEQEYESRWTAMEQCQ